MGDKKITITEKDFAEATAKALEDEHIKTLLNEQPMMVILLTIFSVEIKDKLFKDEEEKKEDNANE